MPDRPPTESNQIMDSLATICARRRRDWRGGSRRDRGGRPASQIATVWRGDDFTVMPTRRDDIALEFSHEGEHMAQNDAREKARAQLLQQRRLMVEALAQEATEDNMDRLVKIQAALDVLDVTEDEELDDDDEDEE